MAIDRIPPDLIPSSGSHVFTQDTIPEALQKEHKLVSGHWGGEDIGGAEPGDDSP